MEEKVSFEEVAKLQKQEVEKNDFVDGVDNVDKASGRIFSRIGKYIEENW